MFFAFFYNLVFNKYMIYYSMLRDYFQYVKIIKNY